MFISYSHEEKARAELLAKTFQSCGYSVWWDPRIAPGQVFSQTIELELNRARCVIVLWTKTSVRSEWVEIEAAKAKARGVLLPVLLDEVQGEIPLEFSRKEAANLVGWQPDDSSLSWDALLGAVGRLTGRQPKSPAHLSAPSQDLRPTSYRWLKYAATLFMVALLVEFLLNKRLFMLRKIGNAT